MNTSGEKEGIEFTRLLEETGAGNPRAAGKLLPLVYDKLRSLAGKQMGRERAGHTLQATALVHEGYLRLAAGREVAWENRSHFYRAAAKAMERILIEHARAKGRIKRGKGWRARSLTVLDLAAEENFGDILAVDEAIRRLEKMDPRAGEVVRLRFFAGLDVEETARVLDCSPRTVMREWTYARAWLYKTLSDDGP